MPSSRNLRAVLLCLAILAGLTIAILWRMPAKEVKKSVTPDVKIVGPVQTLEPGKPIERELKGGEGHAYALPMQAGQYAYVVADQRGIDVAVRWIGPDGHLIVRVDSPNGDQGPEPVYQIAEVSGTYRVEVVCEDARAALGKYEIDVKAFRVATGDDHKRVSAERSFTQGEELRRLGKAEGTRQALAKYQEILPAWRDLGDKEKEAITLYRIGWINVDLNDPSVAIPPLQQALPLFREIGDRIHEAETLNFIGRAEYEIGELDRARDFAGKALVIAGDLKNSALAASSLNIIGNCFLITGEAQKALDTYQQALTAARLGKKSSDEATALFGIGDIQVDQGRPQQALDSLKLALELYRSIGDGKSEALTLKRMAEAYQRQEDLEKARKTLEMALSIAQKSGDDRVEAVILNSLGTVRLLQGNTEPAGDAYRQALALCRRLHDSYNEAFALLNLGRYHFARKELRRSLDYHEQAARMFREQGNLPGETATTFGSAKALHGLGDYKAADDKLKWVLENIEVLRSESVSEEQRTSYFATKQHYFELHIDTLMHLNEEDRAFEINERRRARGLLDLLMEAKAGIKSTAAPELLAEERSLHQALNAVNGSLLKAAAPAQSPGMGTADLERQQRGLLNRLDSVRSEIVRRSPRYAELTHPQPLGLQEIQAKVIDRESIMLVYSLGEERSFLWVIPKTGQLSSYALPGRSEIERLVSEASGSWRRRSRVGSLVRASAAERLSNALLRPVKEDLGTKRLLIVADGALQYVPFAALPDPWGASTPDGSRPPLLVSHEVVSLPSASVLATLRRDLYDRDLAPRRIAVIADPVFGADDPRLGGAPGKDAAGGRRDGGGDLERAARDLGIGHFDRLPYTEDEAKAIRDFVIPEQRFEALGFDANGETVTGGKLKRYRVLHFATHGILDPKNPELSGLVLSQVDQTGAPREDGFLRGYQICDLDLHAELAVLSACQTGLGSEIRGEGLVGLTRSFMYAGVPRIVVSLWNVSDRSTAELMRRFYKGYFQKGLAPSAALRCAQLSMLQNKDLADPYDWAGFIFQGEWSLKTPADGGIEAPPGTPPPARSDNSMPPPDQGKLTGCPDLN